MKMMLLALAGLGQDPAPPDLSQVRSWAYQIQGLDRNGAVDALASSPHDLLVVEPTRTNASEAGFDTKGMVGRLKASPSGDGVHRKLVLAYIDIGQAEDYRGYWTWSKSWKKGAPRPADWPSFIITRDPDGWEGNYPVAFWEPAWKDIVRRGLDEIMKDGFDGVYLDWVAAWEEDDVAAAAKKAGRKPAEEMVALIGEIRAQGRAGNPRFLIVQQNSPALARRCPGLMEVVDGIAQEDVWYRGDADVDWDDPKGYDRKQSEEFTRETIAALQEFKKAGKPVFTVDYAVTRAKEVYETSRSLGFIPYCSRTSLDRLIK